MKSYFIISLMLLCSISWAQNSKKASRFYDAGNFESAMEEYSALLEKSPDNALFSYRLAVCYLNTNINKSAAIPLLENLVKRADADPNAVFLLGRAYQFNNRFQDAIDVFVKFLVNGKGSSENLASTGKQIEYCQNAIELVKFPLHVTFENLGPTINTAAPEFYPFLPTDESFILFNTRRNDGSVEKSNGSFTSNIYMAARKDGKFEKAQKLSAYNTPNFDEYVVGLNNQGNVAVVFSESINGYSDLEFLVKTEKGFATNRKLDKSINTKSTEIAASINNDSTAIYFASDMPGGYGGIDLYVSRRLPNGEWATPQNLGPSVNTIYDEDFPSISPDGQTLFFSSKGHTSMGGYDIFRAEFNAEKNHFMKVRNLGYPINSSGDDMNFRISESGRYGYISAFREGGYGDLDIYRVTFEDVEPDFTVVKGLLTASDTAITPEAAFITVTDLATGELYGEYQPNASNSRYVMILPKGKYHLFVEAEGYKTWEMDLEIKEELANRMEQELMIRMTPQ